MFLEHHLVNRESEIFLLHNLSFLFLVTAVMRLSGWWESSPLWIPSWQSTKQYCSPILFCQEIKPRRQMIGNMNQSRGWLGKKEKKNLRWWRFPLHQVPFGSFMLSVLVSVYFVHSPLPLAFALTFPPHFVYVVFFVFHFEVERKTEMHFDIPTQTHTYTVKCWNVFGVELLLMCFFFFTSH